MAKTSPTQRALKECKAREWDAQVVEYWVPQARKRRDLFGAIDIVAITPGGILGIQVTSASNHAARRTKSLALEPIQRWMLHAQFAVWSYGKRGPAGKRKVWTLREEVLS